MLLQLITELFVGVKTDGNSMV